MIKDEKKYNIEKNAQNHVFLGTWWRYTLYIYTSQLIIERLFWIFRQKFSL